MPTRALGKLKGFDFIGERIAGERVQVVAMDLRGCGKSEVTPLGTYGWPSHARDAFAAADALGAGRFSILGQSMGGLVAMAAAEQDGARLERIVLLDIAGAPDQTPITAPITTYTRTGPS